MKKIIGLLMALLIIVTGSANVLAVEGAAEGTALTSQSYTGIDNDNGVREVAQIRKNVNLKIQDLQNARIKAQENYEGVKKETVSIRDDMIQKRVELKKCDSDNADCAELRTQSRIASGDYLENLADMLIKHLEQVQIRIKLSEQITNEEEIKLIEIIGERKSRLESVKDEIQRLKLSNDADIATRDQIVEKIRNEVKDAKTFLGKISVHVEVRQIKELLAQQEQAGNKIQRILVEMEAEDNSLQETEDEVRGLLKLFNENLDEATKYIELAMENPEETITTEIKSYDQTKDYLKKSRNEIKESYITLHKIVRLIRKDNAEINPGETDPSEISDSAPELNNGEEEDNSEISDQDGYLEEEFIGVSISPGETENFALGFQASNVQCSQTENLAEQTCDNKLSFMIEEYVSGYSEDYNVEVIASNDAEEGTCFCNFESFDGVSEVTIQIDIEPASEISNPTNLNKDWEFDMNVRSEKSIPVNELGINNIDTISCTPYGGYPLSLNCVEEVEFQIIGNYLEIKVLDETDWKWGPCDCKLISYEGDSAHVKVNILKNSEVND